MAITLTQLGFQYAGSYLVWQTQASSVAAPNGTPSAGVDGVVVSGFQLGKVVLQPSAGSTYSFRIWVEYTGESSFFVVDGSLRQNLTESWVQEISISGVERLYVEITSISGGSVDMHVAQATDPET